MPETLDKFLDVIDEAFDATDDDIDVGDEPATSLREYLASAKE